MPEPVRYVAGQRVRIFEEDDPITHVGKMAVVQRVEVSDEGDPTCVLRVDRVDELVSLPQRYLEPVVTIPSSLLANDLFLPWDMDNPKPRLQKYTEDSQLAGHILETLLFYDKIVVPTVDYSIIVPLVHWLGGRILKEMLRSEALSFVRYSGCLGYAGGGAGLRTFEIGRSGKPEPWWVRTARCPPKEAVILQLQHRYSGLNERGIDLLAWLVEICTVDTALPEFGQKVEEETYRDILGSDILTDYFSIRNTDLKRLTGVEPNQMRVFSSLSKPTVAGDEIDITLRLAMLNLEAYLAEEAGARDMVTDCKFGLLLGAKVQRFTGGSVARDSFSRLVTIERLPDVASSITDGEVNLVEAWKFRNTKTASQFRKWFDQFGPTDPVKLEQEYVEALKAGGVWSSGRAKVARFIVLQTIGGALVPATGGLSFLVSMGLSVADSFLLERVRLGYNPRYFIDELQHNLFPR